MLGRIEDPAHTKPISQSQTCWRGLQRMGELQGDPRRSSTCDEQRLLCNERKVNEFTESER